MAGPDPAVAAVRAAVRRSTADLPAGALVLAACSGGADSLALAAALGWTAPRDGLRAGVVTVDHGLREGSAAQAARVVTLARDTLRLELAECVTVRVEGVGGPEAAARRARYDALAAAANRLGAAAVLLGHTRDDQAETVLLGLARGAGARSLAGMAPVRGRYRRPLLGLSRSTTRAACAAQGLAPWTDPANSDPTVTRVRVRTQALPALELALGPGVAAALARSARLLRADADALDALAAVELPRVRAHTYDADGGGAYGSGGDGGLSCAALSALLPAIRARVLLAAAAEAGCPPDALGAVHIDALDALVTGWHGQGAVALPGGLAGLRRSGRLHLLPAVSG